MSYQLLTTVDLTDGAAASIEWSNLPQIDDADIEIIASLRTDGATGEIRNLYMTLNGETIGGSGTYDGVAMRGGGSADQGSTYTSTAYVMEYIPGDACAAGAYGTVRIRIPNYTSNYRKSMIHNASMLDQGTGRSFHSRGSHVWRNTDAITSITLANNVDNLQQYSKASLYILS